jgi:hypothetical protein
MALGRRRRSQTRIRNKAIMGVKELPEEDKMNYI